MIDRGVVWVAQFPRSFDYFPNKMAIVAKNITLRKTTASDIKQICEIYNYYVTLPKDVTTFEEEIVSEEQMLERFVKLTITNNFPHIVAVDENDAVMGYAYGGPYRTRSAYRFSAENSIYLHPDSTRKGLGSLLLKELLIQLKTMGMKQVVALIAVQDKSRSPMLHKKFGFVDAGMFKNIGFKHERWVDVLFMQCDLENLDLGEQSNKNNKKQKIENCNN